MHPVLAWASRCIPIFSVFAVSALLVHAFIVQPYGLQINGGHHGDATWTQIALCFYCVLLHVLALLFPFRVCWALFDIIPRMKEAAFIAPNSRRRRVASIESDGTGPSCPVPLFVIILPAYKEENHILEETLSVLASHAQASHCYHVYLAMEEKEENVAHKAVALCKLFESRFHRMTFTVHPLGIPGEAQGKSSNESWAAKEASKNYQSKEIRQNIIFTIMDADTHLSSNYFVQVARYHTEFFETADTTMYVAPIVFDRNLDQVPLPVRTADMLWCGAGISSLYDGSTVCIPTSVYSLPMSLVERVGGWDTGPDAIGEDLHMFLKCFYALSGNLHIKVIYSAASLCNVSSDLQGVRGYIDGLKARYKQALRHMWGSLDTGFAFRETVKMARRRHKAQQARIELPPSAPNANWTAFYTSTGLHRTLLSKNTGLSSGSAPRTVHKRNLLTVFHRLFEAHFLPTHLILILGASALYNLFHPSFLVPPFVRLALDISGWLRLAGFCTMLLFFALYERYHRVCVGLRTDEMCKAGLLDEMGNRDGFCYKVFPVAGLAEGALFPIGGFIFGAVPALQAIASHLFTERLTYVVSLKPQFASKIGIATP